jgi:hypothetical protein
VKTKAIQYVINLLKQSRIYFPDLIPIGSVPSLSVTPVLAGIPKCLVFWF